MSELVRELALAGPDVQVDAVVAALAAAFTVVDGPTRAVSRSWLDSFDWRLHRAGLTLEQRRSRGVAELVLCTHDGRVVAEWPGVLTLPGRLGALAATGPAGTALTARVGPTLGVRALLEVAAEKIHRRELRLLNADDKTVARVDLEVAAAPGTGSARIVVTPVRGYEGQARQAERLIAATGASVAGGSRLTVALAARGRRAGDYPRKAVARLDRAAPAATSLATVLLIMVDTVEANLDGVLNDVDTEFLHDLRVAVRRIRSALKLLGDVLPGGVGESLAADFKWLGDLTTPVRDLDVYLLDIVGQTDAAAETADAGSALDPFRRALTDRHRTERRLLVAGLRSARFTAMRTGWRETLSPLSSTAQVTEHVAAQVTARVTGPVRSTGELAADRIARAHRQLLRRGAAITTQSPGAALHDLRKRGKELRALLDLFSSILDAKALAAVGRELKALQDCLGDFQDSEVQAAGVVHFAEQMAGTVPVATLLAMGALSERLDARKRAARARFGEIFTRFDSSSNAKSMQALTKAARG